jgi:stearoyl-CoA desaturase (delta-9 desaturase)
MGGGAVEGSIRWWSRDHRAHHRYTDTDKDPYSVRKGLLYSHFGWMIMKQNPKRIGRTDISDLNDDPIVVWQHRNYIKTVVFMGLIFPCLVTGLGWGDWKGGFIYAGILRIFFVQQATFCVNSLAHWLGDQPFDDRNSPAITLSLPWSPSERATTTSTTSSPPTTATPSSGTSMIPPSG